MDPTTAIPFHFTLQALAVTAAGLLLAWSLVRRRWVGALGAALFATAEALHAGRVLATDDDPGLVGLRFAGIVLLSAVAVRIGDRRPLYATGAAAIVAGTVWGALVGGGIANPSIGPHLSIAAGSVLLAAWAWLASRDSIRLQVLTALVGMLAIAVVAGGGAVSRVAALDKRNEQLRQLGSAATAISDELADSAVDVTRRAALVAPLVAPELDAPEESLASIASSALRGSQVESIGVFDRSGLRVLVSRGRGEPAYDRARLAASPVVRAALAGTISTADDVVQGRLAVVGGASIVRAGSSEIAGAVAIVRTVSPANLRRSARAYAPEAEIVLLGRTTAASEPSLLGIEPRAERSDQVAFERVETATGTLPVAVTTIGPHALRLVVVGSDGGIVEAATGLLRALLIAILAAAALAVVIALWLSARLTRPILDLAEGAERVKVDFLSSLSHELRTPLTPIRGYTELLRRGRVPARRAAAYLDEIGQATGRLERIVALLLDVAAQESGRFHVEREEARPADVLAEAADRWAHEARRHPVRVVASRSLPQVQADPGALARVLDELIDNAVKFSPEGGAIELRARRTNGGVEIAVTDSGIGLSPEQAGELTRAFAQAESGDRRRYGGLGLGLAFVAGVLEAHGSRLALQSEPGGGATFSFTLAAAGMVSRMPARSARPATRRPPAPRARRET